MTKNASDLPLVDRGVLLQASIAFGLGAIQYLLLVLFVDEREVFTRSLVTTFAAIAATQTWSDATTYLPAHNVIQVLAPTLSVVVFAVVVAQTVSEPPQDASTMYAWTALAAVVAAVHRQVIVHRQRSDGT